MNTDEPPDLSRDIKRLDLRARRRCRVIPIGDGNYTGCAFGDGTAKPFEPPCDCPICKGSGIEPPDKPQVGLKTLKVRPVPAEEPSVLLLRALVTAVVNLIRRFERTADDGQRRAAERKRNWYRF